jgi:hypothetical protein
VAKARRSTQHKRLPMPAPQVRGNAVGYDGDEDFAQTIHVQSLPTVPSASSTVSSFVDPLGTATSPIRILLI